jgi:LysW-gamma-L-lysine carboxypeptidase
MRLEKEYVKQKIRQLLLELLRIYTPSGNEDAARNLFENISREFNLELKILNSNSYLLGKGEVLLASHIDTVTGFIDPKEEGEIVYGRGAVDAKGPLTSMIIAGWILNERGIKTTVAALADEERQSKGAKELLSNKYDFKYIIVGEPSNNQIVVEYRGLIQLKLECKGESYHSSSARYNLLIDLMKKLLEISRTYTTYENPTIQPTILKCGDLLNVTPSNAEVYLDIRYPYNFNSDNLIEDINNKFNNCTIKILEKINPVKVSVNSPIVRAMVRSLIKIGERPKIVRKNGTSDMNILHNITENIIAFGPGDSSLEHTNYEKISLEELYKATIIYINTIEELCLQGKLNNC